MAVASLTHARPPRSAWTSVAALVAGLALVIAGASPAAAAVMSPVRLVVGAKAVTDTDGATWTAASGTVGGKLSTSKAGIAGTTDDALYQRELTNLSAWDVRVGEPGTYSVVLRQAELTAGAAGKRVFDVMAEGAVAVSRLDIYHRAGGKNRALDVAFDVVVDDGTLDLAFVGRVGQPKASAIQVTQKPPPPAPTPTSEPTVARPGPDNTGVPAGTVLTPHYGNLTITTAGTHLDSLDIHGYVTISAPNVKITRSVIRGSSATLTSATPLVKSYDLGSAGLVIEDSEIRPAYPSYWQDGIGVQNGTLRRVEITGTVDGVGVHGDNVHVVDSWIHDLRSYSSVPNQSDGKSHNDGIQVHLGKGLRVSNSTITGGSNAAVMVTPNTGVVSDAQIVGNWLDHGGCTVNVSEKGRGPIEGLVITDNRFGRSTSVADCAIIMPPTTTAVAVTTGNVWDDTGDPIRVRTGA